MKKVKLFYSYSHKDEAYREKLETHLAILRRNGFISEWHDRRISAGDDWEEEINYNLEDADIILLLVSSNFLASDYCYDTETIRAIEKYESGEAVVIPIVLRPCLWQESKLAKLQALPGGDKPIAVFDNEDVAWLEVAKGILEKVKEIGDRKPATTADGTKPNAENLCALILQFLVEYDKWYFSPLRIQKWGARQQGYRQFSNYTTKEIKDCLEKHKSDRKVKTTKSQKGNTIYKSKD